MRTKEQRSKYNKEYFARPEVIEKEKIKNARPEMKLARKRYKQTEAGRKSNLKYRNKPEIKAKYENYRLKVRYGITTEEYWELVASQNGVCAICQKTDGKKLHVDHDHKTKKVRGLLCGSCNRGIGLFYEDKDLFLKAIAYLKS